MDENKYYAMFGSERRGPMSLEELRCSGITPSTPVWHPGMADWAEASALPELASFFAAAKAAPAYGQQPPYQPYNQQPPYHQPASNYGGNQGYGMPPCPNNYLVWSILVTILCCLVGGIVALVYSSKVQTLYQQGDYDGALRASNNAKNWCIGSAVVSVVANIFIFFIYGAAFFAELASM